MNLEPERDATLDKPAVAPLVEARTDAQVELRVVVDEIGAGDAAVGGASCALGVVVHRPDFAGQRQSRVYRLRIGEAQCALVELRPSGAETAVHEIPADRAFAKAHGPGDLAGRVGSICAKRRRSDGYRGLTDEGDLRYACGATLEAVLESDGRIEPGFLAARSKAVR